MGLPAGQNAVDLLLAKPTHSYTQENSLLAIGLFYCQKQINIKQIEANS